VILVDLWNDNGNVPRIEALGGTTAVSNNWIVGYLLLLTIIIPLLVPRDLRNLVRKGENSGSAMGSNILSTTKLVVRITAKTFAVFKSADETVLDRSWRRNIARKVADDMLPTGLAFVVQRLGQGEEC